MSITETATTPPPKPKRHARSNKRRPAAAAKPSIVEGITVLNCPTGCKVDRCVISGMGVCVHPKKGGLHSNMQMKPDIVRRYNDARAALGDK